MSKKRRCQGCSNSFPKNQLSDQSGIQLCASCERLYLKARKDRGYNKANPSHKGDKGTPAKKAKK